MTMQGAGGDRHGWDSGYSGEFMWPETNGRQGGKSLGL